MLQLKFTVEESQAAFLNNFKLFGFKNKSSLVREALKRLKKDMEIKKLEESADLYAEIYAEDSEIRDEMQRALNRAKDDFK